MTARKHLKARIRARMAKTGERYVTAHRHVVGEADPPVVDHGYRLRGGVHPDTAAVANVLAHHGVVAGHTGEPLSEAMVLGIGGGLGAGYILWEFESRGRRDPRARLPQPLAVPGPLDEGGPRAARRAGRPPGDRRRTHRGAAARRGAGRRPPGAGHDRPPVDRLLAPAGRDGGPWRLPGGGVRDRRRRRPRRRPRARAADRRRDRCSTPRGRGWARTGTGCA